jgi:uncharacterized protein YyaL (SSP411 family)
LRVQPSRDDKIILEWNAMLASAFLASGVEEFEQRGLDLLRSLQRTHFHEATWWRTEHRRAHATASDLAWLIDSAVDAFELTGDDEWLELGHEVAQYLVEHFWDGPVPNDIEPHVGAGFFSQSDLVSDLSTRPKEIFDGATPSSHATCTRALSRLGICDETTSLLVIAQRLVELAGSLLVSHPGAVVDLVAAAGYALGGVEVVIPGDQGALADHVRSMAMSRTVLITGTGRSPLLEGRSEGWAYVCRAGACDLPVSSVEALDDDLRRSGAWRF